MNALERLAQAGKTNSVGTYTFIDADTIRDADGTSYRLQGYDAPEVAGFKGGNWKNGTAGAADATRTITSLAEQQGFHNVVKLTDSDGKPVLDPNGRQIVELHDSEGRNFTTELFKSGALEPGKFATQGDLDAIDTAKLFGRYRDDSTDFGKAAGIIQKSIEDETIYKTQFKQQAIDEQMYGAGLGTSAVSFRKSDRTLDNRSLNPMSDAWDQGWIGAKEGYYGFMELIGQESGNQYLTDIGEAGITRARAQQEEYAKILTDWKDVNGIKSGAAYIANNAAMSMPYMLTTAAATVAGTLAAPFIGATTATLGAIAVPSMIYAGQTWNEMEGEKDAAVAIIAGTIQGSLDRLGIGALAKSVPAGDMTAAAVNKIMKARGLSKQAAEELLAKATKAELGDFLNSASELATKQLVAKKTATNLLKSSAAEGMTEVAQEAVAYVGATQGSDKEFDWVELNERLTAAVVAGSTLGGAFSVPGSLNDARRLHSTIADSYDATNATATNSARWAEAEAKAKGYVPTNMENINEIHAEIKMGKKPSLTLEDRVQLHKENTKNDKLTVTGTIEDIMGQAWYMPGRAVLSDDILARSRSARVLADLVGANPNRVFAGSSFEEEKHHRVTVYKNMVGRPEKFFNIMNDGKAVTLKDKQRISETFYSIVNKATDKDGNFDATRVPETVKHRDAIIATAKELNSLSDKMYLDQKKHNEDLGFIQNYLHKYKTMSKEAVRKQQKKFESLLQSSFNMNAVEAKKIADAIVSDPNVGDLNEAFSVVRGGIVPASHQKRSLGLSEKAEFQEFMEQDMFANVSHAAKSAARFTSHRDYIGKNGEVVARLLDRMREEGLSDAEVGKIATRMQDYFDAESGNYKRAQSKIGEKLMAAQKHVMMMMTFSGLPLATVSSIVEAALVSRSVDGAGLKTIKSFATSSGKGLMNYMMDFKDTVIGRDVYKDLTADQQRIREAGFYDWDLGAATVTGVTETNAWQQKYYKAFFKANGLTQWTDYTRALRASFAGDFLTQNMEELSHAAKSGRYTRAAQEAELKLRNLGIEINRFAPLHEKVKQGVELTPAEQEFFDTQIRDLTYNFVNEAIMMPQAQNRPLIYQDPRFALFFQFQGFISTFTTKLLPKLYREAFGGGTVSQSYSAWSTIMTMIMLGFLSQHVKDWIKYESGDIGDDDYESKTGLNPYLDTAEYIQRGLLSTGLLGTGERVIEQLFPIYEQRSDNAGDWLYNQAVGESPSLGYIQRVAGAAGALAQGDIGRAAEQTMKAAPIFGPFSVINKQIGNVASDWNFNGE